MAKKIKIPMIIAVILYGVTLLIDLLSVLFQGAVYEIMSGHSIQISTFSITAVFHFVTFIMYISFMLVMHIYKGESRRLAGILMIVVYAVIHVAMPFIKIAATSIIATLQGAELLSAFNVLETFIGLTTSPFTTVSVIFVFIAIGRYGITKRIDNSEAE